MPRRFAADRGAAAGSGRFAPDRLRAGPWRGDPALAHLAPLPGQVPAPRSVAHWVDRLAGQGYRSVLTGALTVAEQEPFRSVGFAEYERLHLLRRELDLLPSAPIGVKHRRGRARDQRQILRVDGEAFDPFWRLDRTGLVDAQRATPAARLRVVDAGGIVGYAVTGRAGPVAYLQRLAVHPDQQRRGVGRTLVIDGLRWGQRRGAMACMVNTQERNVDALRLYEELGFVRQRHGLAVLRLDLVPGPVGPAVGSGPGTEATR
jgi:ribosomal protein S18 acetylase RimI-like enzyme